MTLYQYKKKKYQDRQTNRTQINRTRGRRVAKRLFVEFAHSPWNSPFRLSSLTNHHKHRSPPPRTAHSSIYCQTFFVKYGVFFDKQ